jgi:succinyl-CoA synthetase beta subunit
VDLLEYQGKQLFARHGISVPSGNVAMSVDEAVTAADAVGYPCVFKAQVQIGGRGKLGGITLAESREQAHAHAEAILGMEIRGLRVHEVWVEEASQIEAEYYASVVFDRGAQAALVMLSTKGGMDIEAVAAEDPAAIASLHVDPLLAFQDFHGRRLAFAAGVDRDLVRPVTAMLAQLYEVFVAEDAMLVEVNPLIVTPDRGLRALDAKVTLDGNALYRHPENAALRNLSAPWRRPSCEMSFGSSLWATSP